MKKTNELAFAAVAVFAAACVLLVIDYVAVACCAGNLRLFAAMALVAPILWIAVVSFCLGCRMKWNWKRGVCIALVLTLISWGTSQVVMLMAGNGLDGIGGSELQNSVQNAPEDGLMGELYDELDRKAYEYMLEQGLISEGEEIHGGDKAFGGIEAEDAIGSGNAGNREVVSAEMYVGIQKSDPVTEAMGNAVTFFAAYGLFFAGYKAKRKK